VWYDEMCLIENPFFRATDLNCWACESVRSVLDLSDMNNPRDFQPHTGFPYVVKVIFLIRIWHWLCENARHYCCNFEIIEWTCSIVYFSVQGTTAEVNYSTLEKMYESNRHLIDRDAYRISGTVPEWKSIAELMQYSLEENPTTNQDAHIEW
jgi:hypothetical protein